MRDQLARAGILLALLAAGCGAPARAERPSADAAAADAGVPACPEGMTYIPAKPPDGRADVLATRAICIDKYETTVEEYAECVKARKGRAPSKSCRRWKGKRLPTECATLEDAIAYCKFRGKRLPKLAEWAQAAGHGTMHLKDPWGTAKLVPGGVCWGRKPRQGPCSVGSSPQDVSPYGVHDLAANVREWTYNGEPLGGDLPPFQSTPGARWDFSPQEWELLGTSFGSPGYDVTGVRVGIRCARDLEAR